MKKILRIASAAALVIAAIAAPQSAMAQNLHELSPAASGTRTVYSSDGGAKGVFTITFGSANSYSYKWQNYDVAADGKGAILSICHYSSSNCVVDVYDHDTSGNGTSDFSSGSVTGTGAINTIGLVECNGGSRSEALNCNQVNIAR